MKNSVIFAILSVVVPLFIGCGPSNPYNTVKIDGTVLVDGQPMQDVNVTFNPDGSGSTAYGATDSKGKFTLTIPGAPDGSGAEPGTYFPTFRKSVTKERPPLKEGEDQGAWEEKYPPVIVHVIPERYGIPKTNGIDPVTVEKGKPHVVTFEISTK